jgi:ketosteroid isomerase-like protein
MRIASSLLLPLLLLAPAAAPLAGQVETDPGAAAEEEGLADDDEEDAALGATPSVIDAFFNDLQLANVQQKVEGFYAPIAAYEDPMGRYEGRDQILAHLKDLLGGVQSLGVDVKEEFVSGDETVALWTMTLSHKDLRSGEPLTVDGVTHIRMAGGLVTYQRDYYDLGALVYENVPVVGALVRWVKGKLGN